MHLQSHLNLELPPPENAPAAENCFPIAKNCFWNGENNKLSCVLLPEPHKTGTKSMSSSQTSLILEIVLVLDHHRFNMDDHTPWMLKACRVLQSYDIKLFTSNGPFIFHLQ